jgi:predicted nuclease of restriction endonuclease-like (RecB) superfamily
MFGLPLEMGSGFSFVARQKRIQLDGEDFYIDLLFYNRKLTSVIRLNPAIRDRVKSGHRERQKT